MAENQSEQRLEQALEHYEALIFSLCYRMTNHYFDAQDLTQETFLAYYNSLDRFDGVHEKAYLTKIATNKCLDYLKRADRRVIPAKDDALVSHMATAPPAEKQVLEDLVHDELRELCRSLSPPYDRIAEEYFCQEKTARQISLETGRKLKTIQTQVSRAKQKLRERYSGIMSHQRGGMS